jgi:hypothetical protein
MAPPRFVLMQEGGYYVLSSFRPLSHIHFIPNVFKNVQACIMSMLWVSKSFKTSALAVNSVVIQNPTLQICTHGSVPRPRLCTRCQKINIMCVLEALLNFSKTTSQNKRIAPNMLQRLILSYPGNEGIYKKGEHMQIKDLGLDNCASRTRFIPCVSVNDSKRSCVCGHVKRFSSSAHMSFTRMKTTRDTTRCASHLKYMRVVFMIDVVQR